MKWFLFFCSFVFLFACKADTTQHLPQKKMQAVLEDIHLAESYSVWVNQGSLYRDAGRNYDSLAVYYQVIFKHHNTDNKEFEQSLQWYKQHPEELDSIYARMIVSLTGIENKFNIRKP